MISFSPACASVIGLLAMGMAFARDPKTAEPHDLQLRGDRFPPLTRGEMTAPQQVLVDHILASPRASLDGPFNVLLRSPQMGDLAQQFGAALRFHSSLPRQLNEFAIILTARYWTAQYEWILHHQLALQAGLSPAICDAVAGGRRPAMQSDEEAIYNFVAELLHTKQVSDATFNAVKQKFGEQGVVDLVAVIGYYQFVSMLLNVDRYPPPPGVRLELKPLAAPLPMK